MHPRVCPSCLASTDHEQCDRCGVPTVTESAFELPDPLLSTIYARRYRVLEKIGDGGMGVVYRARDLQVDREIALKVLRRELARDLPTMHRFYREMRATGRVTHPNTVRVYDFGHADDGSLYLAMELLRGPTLAEELDRVRQMPASRAVRIGIQIAKALRAAHAEGIIHRDLKPENVMLVEQYGESDLVKVLDFGIARFAEPAGGTEQRSLTKTGLVVGTPAYVSPEAATGGEAGAGSDLYAVGVLLYQLLCGDLPFDDSNPVSVLYKHVHEAAPRLADRGVSGVPEALEGLVMTLLSKRPEDRPASADALITLLSVSLTTGANALPGSGAAGGGRRDTEPTGLSTVAERSPWEERRTPADRRATKRRRTANAASRVAGRDGGERRRGVLRALLWAAVGAAMTAAVAAVLIAEGVFGGGRG